MKPPSRNEVSYPKVCSKDAQNLIQLFFIIFVFSIKYISTDIMKEVITVAYGAVDILNGDVVTLYGDTTFNELVPFITHKTTGDYVGYIKCEPLATTYEVCEIAVEDCKKRDNKWMNYLTSNSDWIVNAEKKEEGFMYDGAYWDSSFLPLKKVKEENRCQFRYIMPWPLLGQTKKMYKKMVKVIVAALCKLGFTVDNYIDWVYEHEGGFGREGVLQWPAGLLGERRDEIFGPCWNGNEELSTPKDCAFHRKHPEAGKMHMNETGWIIMEERMRSGESDGLLRVLEFQISKNFTRMELNPEIKPANLHRFWSEHPTDLPHSAYSLRSVRNDPIIRNYAGQLWGLFSFWFGCLYGSVGLFVLKQFMILDSRL